MHPGHLVLQEIERRLGFPLEELDVKTVQESYTTSRSEFFTFYHLKRGYHTNYGGEVTHLRLEGIGFWLIVDLLPQFKKLTSCVFSLSGIHDLSFCKSLPQLTFLDLHSNIISDLTPIANLKALTNLNLRSTGISDLTPIASLKKLTYLNLKGNLISDFTPIASFEKLMNLNLCITGISDFTPIASLKKLTYLNLAVNRISDLTPIASLEKLTNLNLWNNSISDLTPITSLETLTNLDVSHNNINDLTPIASLETLTNLDVSHNNINDFTPIASLETLTYLDVSHNNINDFTPIASLKKLTYLNLRGTGISDLTPIASLGKLINLALAVNLISNLTPIASLKALTNLNLAFNRISDLTPIASLKALTNLAIAVNSISDLTPITSLKQLTNLNIAVNRISDLTPIASLKALTNLNIQNNQITDVSIITQLLSLQEFRLKDNPLVAPPPDIAAQGVEAMRTYFAAGGRKELNEVKVILLGEGAVGKTSLLRALRGEKFDEKMDKTHGIEIHHIAYENICIKEKRKRVIARYWDFGGQEIMHATHRFFLSTRSLYIIVLDGRKGERPHYWLEHVRTFGKDSSVLVVTNKIDQGEACDLEDQESLQKKYPFIKGFFRTSCKTGVGIEELDAKIRTEIPLLKLFHTEVPETWLKLKEALEKETSKTDKHYLHINEFENLAKKHTVDDITAQNTLLQFLHDLGVVLHFGKTSHKSFHVLNPKWVTEGVYKVLNSHRIAAQQGLLKEMDWEFVFNQEEHKRTLPDDLCICEKGKKK